MARHPGFDTLTFTTVRDSEARQQQLGEQFRELEARATVVRAAGDKQGAMRLLREAKKLRNQQRHLRVQTNRAEWIAHAQRRTEQSHSRQYRQRAAREEQDWREFFSN